MAKQLINKYVWLVETIYRAGRISLKEINERWEKEMGDEPIPARTFHKWRIAAEEMFNLNIECKRYGGYHYYIENADEIESGGLRNWLLSTISVSNLLLGSRSIKDRILLEGVAPGQDYLAEILKAMTSNTALQITYQSFDRDESNTFVVHPYCVKLFKQRWYLIANSPYYDKVWIYALDRIRDIQRLDSERFDIPDSFDPNEFFRDYYGIIAGTGGKVTTVKLKVAAGQANFLRTVPLHSSQREPIKNDEYSIFTLEICPEFDFKQELLRNGDDVEVLEPAWLRDEMEETIKRMWNHYQTDTK